MAKDFTLKRVIGASWKIEIDEDALMWLFRVAEISLTTLESKPEPPHRERALLALAMEDYREEIEKAIEFLEE